MAVTCISDGTVVYMGQGNREVYRTRAKEEERASINEDCAGTRKETS